MIADIEDVLAAIHRIRKGAVQIQRVAIDGIKAMILRIVAVVHVLLVDRRLSVSKLLLIDHLLALELHQIAV